MKKLFKYQERAYEDCLKFLFKSDLDSGIAIVPTAGGKALILAKLSLELGDSPALFVVPSIDLLRQNAQAIIDEGGDVGIYSGSLNKKEIKPITLATINSLKDAKEFKKSGFKFLIVDEAHYKCSEDGVFMEFYKAMKPKKLLGLTATAFKLKMHNGVYSLVTLDRIKPNIFKDIIHVTQVTDVIEAGRWCPLEYENHLYDGSLLKVNSAGTEYSVDSVTKNNKKENVNKRLVRIVKSMLSSGSKDKILIFTDSLDTADKIHNWINSSDFGIKCAFVTDDTTPKERESMVTEFKDENSNTNVLVNFGTFTTGLDSPCLNYVIMGRPTMSFALYYQLVGRLTRVHPLKKKATYIDLCGNINRFGRIEDIIYLYVEDYGWACFSGERLMTGVPAYSNKVVTIEDLKNPPKLHYIDYKFKMPFGKYEGKVVKYLPKHYRDYMLDNFDFNATEEHIRLKELLSLLRENDFNKLLQ